MKAIFTTIENIDTDQIIPARFLKKTGRDGFGHQMFYDWRFTPDGAPKGDSIFAKWEKCPPCNRPQILVAGKNFGCGSSREHAAWALADYGFKCIISSFFADIFRNNALNNMLLPVQVSEAFLQKILTTLQGESDAELDIDLQNRRVTICNSGEWESFPIGEYKQQCILNNQRDIDFLISTKDKIEFFEKGRI